MKNTGKGRDRTSLIRNRMLSLLAIAVQLLAVCSVYRAHGQSFPLKFDPFSHTSQQAGILSLAGETNQFDAIEFSTDLLNWLPLAARFNTNGTVRVVDLGATNFPTLFYRAREVEKETVLVQVSPSSGPVGTRVEILGWFFEANPGSNLVRFGGQQAKVLEATESRLLVQVPTNATTGPVTVTTSLGASTGKQLFAVSEVAAARFEPLAGLKVTDFDLANSYGSATLLNSQTGDYSIVITREMPLITVAAPKDTNRQTFFYAVSLSATQTLIINASSTAQTLVFANPLLATSDPFLAGQILETIRNDAKVQALTQVISQLYTQAGDPFTNSIFLQAYSDAIISVGNSGTVQTLSAQRGQAEQGRLVIQSQNTAVFPVEWYVTRFLELAGGGTKFKVQGFPFNPVDWVVLFQEVDVNKAFPNGRRDFDQIINRPTGGQPELFPVLDGFLEQRSVSADLAFSRFNLVSYLSKALTKRISGDLVDERVIFPRTDTIYLMRGVGPAFVPEEDFSFVTTNLPVEYARAVAINLVSAIMDLSSGAIDSGALQDLSKNAQLITKLVNEVFKLVPTIKAPADFVGAASKLAAFFIKEAINNLIKDGAKAFAKAEAFEAGSAKLADTAAAVVAPPLKVLKIVGAVGAVAERASGLFRTTTLEDTFILIGDPFKLEILSVTPPGASLGDKLSIIIRGAHFDLQNVADHVDFESFPLNGFFQGQVIGASDLTDGRQQLTVTLPRDANAPDGVYNLFVNAQGRRGQTNYTVSSIPIITSMIPSAGFAAVSNFLGQPFPGAQITILGFSFSRDDTFIFAGGIEATNKSATSGGVTLRVPNGAQSGPIIVRRRFSATDIREGKTPPFTVFGPPLIDAMSPGKGPISTFVNLTVRNIGSDSSLVRVGFAGTQPGPANLLGGDRLSLIVPAGIQTGPVTVLTPAGASQTTSIFTLLPGVAAGGTISVGSGVDNSTNPGVTLDRAFAFVSGAAVPQDDSFIDPVSGQVRDPDFDPATGAPVRTDGDFVTDNGFKINPRFPVGPAFANTISIGGTIVGDFTLTNDFNTLFTAGGALFSTSAGAAIQGTLTIAGNNNIIDVAIRGSSGHGLVIRGNGNKVTVRAEDNAGDGVRIEGGQGNNVEVWASRNGGNGVTLTGGALGNYIGISTGSKDPVTRALIPNSGNQGQGVFFVGEATGNVIGNSLNGVSADARFPAANQGDGVRLEGAGVKNNTISVTSHSNGGNGVTFAGGANTNVCSGGVYTNNLGHGIMVTGGGTDGNMLSQKSFRLDASYNRKSGVALIGANAVGPKGTKIEVTFCQTNADYGILISGIVDEPGSTEIRYLNGFGNKKAGLRLEKGTSGFLGIGSLVGGAVGVEIDGADVVSNRFSMQIDKCAGNGVAITNAQSNELTFNISNCGGTGIVLSGAKENRLIDVHASQNRGDGLRLTDGAEGNILEKSGGNGNQNGLVLDGGARNNVIQGRGLLYFGNRENGILLQGLNTSSNQFYNLIMYGSGSTNTGGDGIRIQGGASDNIFGSATSFLLIDDSAGAGIRITGDGTRGNVVMACTVGSQSVHPLLAGVVIEDQAAGTVIGGINMGEGNSILGTQTGITVRGLARNVVIQNNIIQPFGHTNAQTGILIDNASGVLIGGNDPGSLNNISSLPTGVQLQGMGATNCQLIGNSFSGNTNALSIRGGANNNVIGNSNLLSFNQTAIIVDGGFQNRFFQNTIANNTGPAMLLINGAQDNFAADNNIFGNFTGVAVIGPAALRNAIQQNSITGNSGNGIVLIAGGNREIQPPILTESEDTLLIGTADAPDGSTVEIFQDPIDEGKKLIATSPVFNGKFRASVGLKIAEVGSLYQLTGTVTDPLGNTSEFGVLNAQTLLPCLPISINPATLDVSGAGGTVTTTIKVTGNVEPINLSVSGLPTGVTATFNPNPIPVTGNSSTNSSTLTLVISSAAPPGSYPFTIKSLGTVSGCKGKKMGSLSKTP